jgi:hypothetical protein
VHGVLGGQDRVGLPELHVAVSQAGGRKYENPVAVRVAKRIGLLALQIVVALVSALANYFRILLEIAALGLAHSRRATGSRATSVGRHGEPARARRDRV